MIFSSLPIVECFRFGKSAENAKYTSLVRVPAAAAVAVSLAIVRESTLFEKVPVELPNPCQNESFPPDSLRERERAHREGGGAPQPVAHRTPSPAPTSARESEWWLSQASP